MKDLVAAHNCYIKSIFSPGLPVELRAEHTLFLFHSFRHMKDLSSIGLSAMTIVIFRRRDVIGTFDHP